MKSPFELLDRVLEHRVRLHIMSVLVANESFDFNSLKDVLSVTDGNLATHLKALEGRKYISINKLFIDRKPNTRYRCTETGRSAFRKHLEGMEELIRIQKNKK